MNDMFFISSTGYSVGHKVDFNTFFYRVGSFSKTTDGGLTWTSPTSVFSVGNDTIVDLRSVHFTSPVIGYVTAICITNIGFGSRFYGALIKTTDGGFTWSTCLSTKSQVTPFGPTTILNDVQFTSLNTGYMAASYQSTNDHSTGNTGSGLVYYTTNAGASWTNTVSSANAMTCSVFFNSQSTGSASSGTTMNSFGAFATYSDYYRLDITGGEIARSTDGGNTWSNTYADPNRGISDIHFPSTLTGYAIGTPMQFGNISGNVLKTIDGGQTWNSVHLFSNVFFQPRCIYFIDDTTGFAGGWSFYTSTDAFYKTTDGGLTWVPQSYPTMTNFYPRIVSITSTSPVTLYALSDSAYSSLNYSSSLLGDFPTSSCTVFLGPDTTFCQSQGQLFATPATPGNDYIFSWSTATGLNDSTSQSPFVSNVMNQQYIVTMTDTVTNCTATDTIIVTSYNVITGPQYICTNDSTLLDFGPGAVNYNWQSYIDTAGNVSFINQNTQTYWATQQGYYLGIATFTGCGSLTSYVQVLDTCGTYAWVNNVWPGDCDYNLNANNADVLQIGLGYGATGATRPNASNGWYAQPMADWTQNYVNCNYKHGDADGNGIIDMNDTLPITINYGNTHPYRLAPVVAPSSSPVLYLVANYDTVGLQTLITVDIRLGTSALPVDSLYGISFRLTADAGLIDTNLTIVNLNSTWLGTTGTDVFNFRKYFLNYGRADVAESRNNHINHFGGNGTIGTFLIVTTDNLSGIATCHITISDVTAVTASQHYLTLATVNDSVVIDASMPAVIHSTEIAPSFNVYPNPANSTVTIQTSTPATQIEITDMQGRVITTLKPASSSTTIDTSSFASGVYFLHVQNGNAVTTQKLSVTH